MRLNELIDRHRREILRIAERHGASEVRIIGSVARGDANELSDLDLLVRFASRRSLLDHAALVQDLEQLLGCKVDVASEDGLRPRVKARVLPEAVPL